MDTLGFPVTHWIDIRKRGPTPSACGLTFGVFLTRKKTLFLFLNTHRFSEAELGPTSGRGRKAPKRAGVPPVVLQKRRRKKDRPPPVLVVQ
jgi:hypothetical protein